MFAQDSERVAVNRCYYIESIYYGRCDPYLQTSRDVAGACQY
jgi:hypothetical protein